MSLTEYTHDFAPDGLAALTTATRAAVDDGEVPGFVTLIERDGVILHRDELGFSDIAAGRPMTADTICRIASMTKPIVSAALMMLVEDGRLQIDDPVARYLPAFGRTRVYAGGGLDDMRLVDQDPVMTVKHLLTHTAGLSYGNNDSDHPVDRLFAAADVLAQGNDLAEMVDRLASVPLRWQPSTVWHYGFATTVVGHLIEVVSGQSLPDFLETRLFAPLGMADTGFHVAADDLDRLAIVYDRVSADELRPAGVNEMDATLPPHRPSGSGGLFSTANDYLRFMRLIRDGGELDGVRLLQPETVAQMKRNHIPSALIPITMGSGLVWSGFGFGLGYTVLVDPAAAGLFDAWSEYFWGGMYSTVGTTWRHTGTNHLCLTQVPGGQTDILFRLRHLTAAACRPSA